MEPKLRDYIENLFKDAPKTKQTYELKEEIIRNTIERYHDLLSEGKTEGEAYNLAIAGIGDINELLEALGGEPVEEVTYTDEQLSVIKSRRSMFTSIAIALYILCITPPILMSEISMYDLDKLGPALMFFMISTATGLLIYSRMTKFLPVTDDKTAAAAIRRNAVLRAVAVGMYISCPTTVILLDDTFLINISPVFLLLVIAAATVMIILSRNKNIYTKTDDTMVENFKEWNSKKKSTSALYKVLVAVLWVTVSILYICLTTATMISISPMTATVTWIIFLVAVAIQNLMRAIFDYVEAGK